MSEIDEEFKKLIQMLQSPDITKIKVEEATKLMMDFFQKLQTEMQQASPEERVELVAKMNEMYKRLLQSTHQISQRLGLNEQDLMNYVSNPQNFTPEQWKEMQDAQKMLSQFGKTMAQTAQPGQIPPPEKPSEGKPKPKKKSSRDKWLRS